MVSVVIPTFNRSQALLRAVKSVQNQSYQELEILIVDDASTDDTQEAVYALNDSRIKYFRHEKNLFAGAARNTGMDAAQGEYIAFLDSDDTWYPDKLSRQLDVFHSNPDAGFCLGGVLMKKGRGYRERVLYPKLSNRESQQLLIDFLTGKVHVFTSAFMFRTCLIKEIGNMDANLRRNQDMDFYLRMINVASAASLEQPLAEFYPNYSPPSLDLVEKSNLYLLEKHRDLIDGLGVRNANKIRGYYKFMHGKRHLERGDFFTGIKWLWDGVKLDPVQSTRQYGSALYRILMRPIRSVKRLVAK